MKSDDLEIVITDSIISFGHGMISFDTPVRRDILAIRRILLQWTDPDEAEKYIERIQRQFDGQLDHGMRFWVVRRDEDVVGVGGIADILPKIRCFCGTDSPGEIKVLYLDKNAQGLGVGRNFMKFMEKEAKKAGYSELLIRSNTRYKDTAYGFYEKVGYERVGDVEGGAPGKVMAVFRRIL